MPDLNGTKYILEIYGIFMTQKCIFFCKEKTYYFFGYYTDALEDKSGK